MAKKHPARGTAAPGAARPGRAQAARWFAPLVALVVVAGLAAWVFVWQPRQAERQNAPLHLADVDTSKVNEITMENQQMEDLGLLLQGSKWTMVNGAGRTVGEADAAQVRAFLDRHFRHLTAAKKIENPGKASEYGFGDPRWVVTVTQEDGSTVKVTIGANDPITGNDYALVDGHPGVYLLSPALAADLSVDPKHWSPQSK